MSVFVMKLIALCSMLIDHSAIFLYPRLIDKPVYLWLRAVGRIAFPIYAFLIVNGFLKTRDVKRYLTRLIAFAALSQIPYTIGTHFSYIPGSGFSYALDERWFVCLIFFVVIAAAWLGTVRADASVLWPLLALVPAVLRLDVMGLAVFGVKLNVFYTLALALALVALTDAALKPGRDVIRLLMQALALFGAFYLIRDDMDYRTLGVALIYSIWLARASRFSQAAVLALWCVVEYIVPALPIRYFIFALLALLPILLYNGAHGRPLKLAFYAAYPVHLLILGALNLWLARA